jgi:hypothetical protein
LLEKNMSGSQNSSPPPLDYDAITESLLASGATTPKLVGDDSAVKIENMDLGNVDTYSPGNFAEEKTVYFSVSNVASEVPRTPVGASLNQEGYSVSVGRAVSDPDGDLSLTLRAHTVGKLCAVLGLVTTILTYIVGSISGKYNGTGLSFWPLRTISVYGSTLPAAWIFRSGFIICGMGITLFSLMIKQGEWFRRSYLFLFVGGMCLITCAAISCAENNAIHSMFAVFFFFLNAFFCVHFGWTAKFGSSQEALQSAFKKVRLHGLVGGIFLLTELAFLILVFSKVVHMERNTALPLLEWPGVVVILTFLWKLSDFLDKGSFEQV